MTVGENQPSPYFATRRSKGRRASRRGPSENAGAVALPVAVLQQALVELTGGMAWAGRMARRYHEYAEERSIKLIFSADYEALPFDIATLMAVRSLQEQHGVDCLRADVVATAKMPKGMGPRDLLSGGSINTLCEELRSGAAEDMRDPAALRRGLRLSRRGAHGAEPRPPHGRRRHMPVDPPIFGVVTPATGLGPAILDRLRDAEITLEVKDTPPDR